MKAKYLGPFTTFGFKKVFGQEASKPLLRDFLNALLLPTAQIRELAFKNNEQPGTGLGERKAILDIYCESETGEKFIVELQKAKQNYFKDRMVFYSTFPIREQAEAGMWSFALKTMYCVGILKFVFNESGGGKEVLHARERDTPHVVALRQDYFETVAQHYDNRRFHFLDETGLRPDACCRYARAPVGSAWGRLCRSNMGLRSRSSAHSLLKALGRCNSSRGRSISNALRCM